MFIYTHTNLNTSTTFCYRWWRGYVINNYGAKMITLGHTNPKILNLTLNNFVITCSKKEIDKNWRVVTYPKNTHHQYLDCTKAIITKWQWKVIAEGP
ncbi:hypothetical protein Pelo_5533 [Pelomyxa schiedti]|nr:hypothetical protein Pelo_5533 [Pelomyxa schiedti]